MTHVQPATKAARTEGTGDAERGVKTKQIHPRVPEELANTVAALAQLRGESLADVVARALERELEELLRDPVVNQRLGEVYARARKA